MNEPIKICERCGAHHDGSYGSGRFCSRSCATSYASSHQTDKISRGKALAEYLRINPCKRSRALLKPEARLKGQNTRRRLREEKLCKTPFEQLGWTDKRKRVLLEQDGKCLICGIREWQGKYLAMELDHIDGDRKNNARSNFRILCPNCHTQTPTFRSKNRTYQKLTKNRPDGTELVLPVISPDS